MLTPAKLTVAPGLLTFIGLTEDAQWHIYPKRLSTSIHKRPRVKFKPGQLVKAAENLNTDYGLCIVIGDRLTFHDGSSLAYDVWSTKKQQKLMLHERYLSPINPQEAESGV